MFKKAGKLELKEIIEVAGNELQIDCILYPEDESRVTFLLSSDTVNLVTVEFHKDLIVSTKEKK